MKIHLARNLPSALTLILSTFVISTRAAFYWTLYDFDVINDTNETCHGFEIELEGIHKEDITYTFGAPMSRYGDPTREDKFDSYGNVVGCYLRYRAEFDETNKQFIQKTLAVSSAQPQRDGHYACDFKDSVGDEYDKSGCERFGLGFLFGLNNPSKTTFRWLIENPEVPGELMPFSANVTIPAPIWTLLPQGEPTTIEEQVSPVVRANFSAEPNKDCSKYGEALWVKASTFFEGMQNSTENRYWEGGMPIRTDQSMSKLWDEIQAILMQQSGTREEVTNVQQFLSQTLEKRLYHTPSNVDISALMEKLLWHNDALLELLNKIRSQMESSPSWNMISQLSNFETSTPDSVGTMSPYSMETVMAWVQQLFETYQNNNFSEPIYLQDARTYSGQPNSAMRQLIPNKYVVSLPLTADQCAIKMEFPCDEDGKTIHNRDDIIESIDGFELIGRSINDVFRALNQTQSSGYLNTINLHLLEYPKEDYVSDWLLMQALPTCDEYYLPISETTIVEAFLVGDRRRGLIRRYEFFRYTGVYDLETHEALPIHDTIPVAADIGSFIGAQMPSVKYNDPLLLSSGSLPPAVVGMSYSQILVSGGVQPYDISISFSSSHEMPEGFMIDTNIGILFGTPTAVTAGRVLSFILTVTDSVGESASSLVTLEVVAPVTIDASMLPVGESGIEYSAKLATLGGASPMNWSVEGELPLGIKFSYSSGVLFGKPLVSGSYPLLFKVYDLFQQTSEVQLTLKIVDPVMLSTSFLTRGVNGQFYSITLSSVGGVPPLRWTAAGALPSGISFDPRTAVLSGPSSSIGSYMIAFTVTDALRSMSMRNLTLTLVDPLVVVTPSLPQARFGASYLHSIRASGGEPPFKWSISNGTLPKGMEFDSDTAVLSGAPLMVGSFPITFTVIESSQSTAQALLSKKVLTLVVVKPINFTTSTLPEAVQGVALAAQLSATTLYPPLNWFVIGRLPSGVTLNATSGMLSGTPSINGTYNLTIQVKDAAQQTSEKPFTFTVFAPLNITTSVLRSGIVGRDYEAQIGAIGGKPPLTWYLNSSTTSGVTISNSTGLLRGRVLASGPFSLILVVKDSLSQIARKTLFLNISNVLNITNSSLPFGIQGKLYSATIRASGGKFPFTWMTNSFLPPGLTFNAETATLSGIPTTNGTFFLDFSVKDIESQYAQRTFVFNVVPPINITTSSLPPGTFRNAYSARLNVSGGALPLTWTIAGTLPPGLKFNTSTGSLSGTPAGVGSFSLVFTVKDSVQQSVSKNVNLLLSYAILKVANISLPNAIKGSYYTAMLNCSGGMGPYTWSLSSGQLPLGLSLSKNPTTGFTSIVGTPTSLGISNITLKVTDSNRPAASAVSSLLTIRVTSARM
jgi:hypothetical protein